MIDTSRENSSAPGPEQYEFPVSFAQQRLWFLDQLEGPGPAYNVKLPVRLSGPIDRDALQAALDHVVDRHESLRTTFGSRNGEPAQIIASSVGVPLELHDLHGATQDRVRNKVAELALQVFDLATGPLLRVHLMRLDADEYLLLLVMHHIIGDAWSSSVLFHDIARAYDAMAAGEAPGLADLTVQYADFTVWQREWLAGPQLDRQVDYWRRQLAGAPGLLEWPADRSRPRRQTYNGGRVSRGLSSDLTAGLKALAQRESCTLFMVMLAALDVLMARYTGSDDVVVGTPIAGRRRTELEGLVGLFVNTLVMRADLEGNPPFVRLLEQVRATALDAYSHQELPFEKLVELLQPVRDMSHTPLFQTMFILQNAPWEAQPIRGVTVSPGETSPGETAKFDLTLSANEFEGALWLNFEYNSDLFDRATVETIADGYEILLGAIVEHPATPVQSLPVQADGAGAPQFEQWNDTAADYDRHSTVERMVAAQAMRTPDSTAIECDHEATMIRWTYADLMRRTAECAGALEGLLPAVGVPVVAIFLDRAPAMTSALLGAARAGAAYLPLDPIYPPDRLTFMLEDAGAAVIVTNTKLVEHVPPFTGAVIVLDDDGHVAEIVPGRAPNAGGLAPGTAYLIYTSGSTGVPKGVVVPHAALVNFLVSMAREPGIGAGDRLLAVTTLSFDIAALELLLPLTVGAASVIAPSHVTADGYALAAMIADSAATVMQATPATWRMLLNAGWRGQPGLKILCGGEPLDRPLAARLLKLGASLWNMYGPTETTIWSTCAQIKDSGQAITVGRPIANTQAHVLDAELRPAPIGVAGELYIGGDGLAFCYHGRPQLTAERFVVDPFTAVDARLYRTGDRARWRGDGMLELLGRTDRQVKLRGFRIELGEIEAAIGAQDGIEGAAVVLQELAPNDRRLVAYIVCREADDEARLARLRDELQASLPDYMVPSLLVPLASLPLTPNGKVDRRALPMPDWAGIAAGTAVAPRDATEAALAGLFGEVLGRPAVGIHDGFFDLGGHSLLATQLVARIRDAFDVGLPLRALFDTPTVAGLAALLCSDETDRAARDYQQRRDRLLRRRERYRHEAPASFVQQRLWFLDQLEPGNPVYNLAWAIRVVGNLDVPALEQAVAAVVNRHESLRTTFASNDGAPLQRIAADATVPVVIESLTVEHEPPARARRIAAIAKRPFDLATGPLLRVHVLQVAPDEHVLVLVIHHIVADGWSMSVLFRELASAYDAYRAGRAPDWPALPVQYADYALWQRGWLCGAELERQLDYWRRQLDGAPAQLALPTDRPRPPLQTHRGARIARRIPVEVMEALKDLGRDTGCTLFMVLLAAFDAVLARYTGQADIVVGTPIAGRGRTELEGLIGFFVNTLVLRADLGGDPRFDALLARVKRVALDAYAHQDVPFERIVDELKPDRDTGRTPVFQVMFNLHNEPAAALRLGALDVRAFGIDRNTAKFDLSVSLNESDRGLFAYLEYNTDLFDAETIKGLGAYYEQVLGAVAAAPGLRLSELPLRGRAGAARPAAQVDRQAVAAHGDLVAAFNAQVAAGPKRLAVQTQSCSLSYGALDARANRVARQLLSLGLAGPSSTDGYAPRVGLWVSQEAPLVPGLLGILKAGAACVALEPSQPAARLQAIAADAGVSAIVSDGAHAGTARSLFEGLPVIDSEALDDVSGADPGIRPQPDALAYILYTSGTTGAPKGVMQTHGGALAQVNRYRAGLGLTERDRLSLLSGYGYDAAVQDLFGALLTGAALYPFDLRGSSDTLALVDRLVAARITVVHATPTVYRHLFGGELNCDHDLAAVRLVVLGGEVARRSDFELFRSRFARGTVFVNGFGLTESTMGLQGFAAHDTRLLGQQVPVGTAVAGLEAELFDAAGAVSWRGEIRLRGAGVFAGYWGHPEWTAGCVAADGWYRTGDIGRRLPDGQIVYEGRRDEQLKLRGQRVEPGEIEAVLGGLPGVVECAVRQVERPGEAWLVAYVVTAGPPDEAAADGWRAGLAERLPRYMVPQAFEWLAQLPRRSNGKLARQRLPAPGSARARPAVPARTELEAVLAGLWSDVLGLDAVGVHDDFFALGGHSLLATRLVSRIRDRLGVEVPLVALFEGATVARLADTIESGGLAPGLDAVNAVARLDRDAPARATGVE